MDDRLKQELQAHSQKTSLDKLQSQGKKRVRVIKADAIAAMIEQAVQRAVSESDAISEEEAKRLIEESRAHLKSALQERQPGPPPAGSSGSESSGSESPGSESASSELERLRAENEKLRAGAAPGGASPPAGDAVSSELLLHMMKEIASIKANPPQPAVEAGGDAMSSAIDKMASTMNERLEQLGKKLGISSAVDAADVNFEGLFNDMDDPNMESNIDDMEVKQKTGSGIAANLARLKKLKGGGD